ncbi:DnaJ domain-containing protein [Rufibacter glacialis]|uniref:DnaJ domain-containing protein n=1 Tax=Rufibacter glacialis TaxID=1259555 RepID=A0ABV4RH08_9BACT|nr:DnaJ domain-containing protein [Rufibacter glacialis]GGK80985.1 hypothetical protein GCM10011405_30930 [Rufibacter glacialis]
MDKNYYQLLGLKPRASQLEIKEAYRKLSKKVHPDLNQGEVFFEEYFKEVKEAYEVLSDPERKRQYDTRQYRPLVAASPILPSNLKNLEYQVSRLELKLQDQNEQMDLLQAEKKALHQELDHFVQALFEVKNEKTLLQKKVKELEKEQATVKKEQPPVVRPAEGPSPQELQRRILALEQELQRVHQSASSKRQELTQETQKKQALEKRVQELSLASAKQHQLEKQVQALAQEAEQHQTRLAELQEIADQATAELQAKTKELERVLLQRQTLQGHLQELEQRQQQPPLPIASSKEEKGRHHQNQLLEITTQNQALQTQVHDLELATEQLKQVLQDKNKLLQQEKTQKQDLQGKIKTLDIQLTRQQQLLNDQTTRLEQEVASKNTLLEKIRHLEEEESQLQVFLKTKTQEKGQLSQQLMALENARQTLEQEIAQLRTQVQALELQAAQDKTALKVSAQALEGSHQEVKTLHHQLEDLRKTHTAAQQALHQKTQDLEKEAAKKRVALGRIQELEKEKSAQVLKERELQKEMTGVVRKYAHLALLQPFLVEHMDFFNSAAPEQYGTSFERADIKYIFSRMKITVLTDKPGTLPVLVKYLKPNGQLYFNPKSSPTGYSFAATISYSPEEEYLYLSGWGSDRETTFVAGDHRVEIYDQSGRQLANANFQVKEKMMTVSKIRNFFQPSGA